MKKNLLLTLLAALVSFSACADNEQIISFDRLPAAAQTMVKKYFSPKLVSYCSCERELTGREYELRLDNGTELKFDSRGELLSIDCQHHPVPAALIPETVRKQVTKRFPRASIVEWSKERFGYKAELNNGLELEFNSKLQLTKVDD